MTVLVMLALGIAGCGKTARTTGHTGERPTSQACASDGVSDACRRYLERVAGAPGIRLSTHGASQVTASCAAAARVTRIKVVCPPLVPADGVVSDPRFYGPQLVDRSSYSVSINNGQNPGHIHWEFGAGRAPATRFWYFDRRNWDAPPPKHPPRRFAARRYLGHLITLYRFPDSDGQLEGHDAAFATKDGITYFASIHGRTHDAADIAILLAVLLASNR